MEGARPEAVHLCGPEASAGQASAWAVRAPAEEVVMLRGLGRLQSPCVRPELVPARESRAGRGLWAPTLAQSLSLHCMIWCGPSWHPE